MDTPKDTPSPKADATTELPVVVLGAPSPDLGADALPQVRVLRGRVNVKWFAYSIYGGVVGAGALAIFTTWTTKEWALSPVLLTWAVLIVWCRLYTLTWRYRRRILGSVTLLSTLALHLVLIGAMWDKAAPQRVAHPAHLELGAREALPQLQVAAVMLGINVVLLLLHWAWFGRGWRAKKGERKV